MKIAEVFKTVEKSNPISGHEWTEQGESIGFEVYGGLWCRQRHRTYERAVADKEVKESIDRKFPYKGV